MRYKLFFIRQHSWGIELAIAPNIYYTGNVATFDDIFTSENKKTVFTLNGSPEKDLKFKNLIPVDSYNQTYIVNIGEDTFKFLLVSEKSKLFNYDLINSSSKLVHTLADNLLSSNYDTISAIINRLYNLQKEIGSDIAEVLKKKAYID